jgi:radical SAM superfamily enzyme YgiQ (UPF0313 family)
MALKKPFHAHKDSTEMLLYPSAPGGHAVAILYPNSYFLGMSNLGFHALNRLAISVAGLTPERFFLESAERSGVFSLENRLDLGRAKIILATLCYEEDALNLLDILERAGIEPDRNKRQSPVIIAGGMLTSLCPRVISPVADVLYRGYLSASDKEGLAHVLQGAERDKDRIIDGLSSLEGAWIPSKRDFAPGRVSAGNGFEDSLYLARDTEFSRMFLMEIGRGCPFHCEFCPVRNLFPKVSWRGVKDILETVAELESRRSGSASRIGLISPVPNFHPRIKEILSHFSDEGKEVSLSSIRIGSTDREFFRLLRRCRQKSFTIAPEVPGEIERKMIGKAIPDAAIFQALRDAFEEGFRDVKMYFLMGITGMQNPADVEALKVFLSQVPRGMRTRLSFNPVVPKLCTGLAGKKMAGREAVRDIIARIRKAIQGTGGVSATFGSLKSFELEYTIANGDERTLFELRKKLKRDQ